MWPSTSTGVPMRKVAVTFTFLLCTGVAAETLQPLTGWADDSNGHLVWTSSSTRSSSQPSWMIRHTVENKAPDGNLRVVWEPDIYDGWVPHGAERGSGGTDGPETPQAQIGSITYGKSGKKSASSYRPASEKTPPASIATDISITININDKFENVNLTAISESGQKSRDFFTTRYTLRLLQKHLTTLLRAEWTAARSAEFDKVIQQQSDSRFIRFNPESGQATYEVQTAKQPFLHTGAIVLRDRDGNRLGAAYAPAFAP